jgi:hypothetical protein
LADKDETDSNIRSERRSLIDGFHNQFQRTPHSKKKKKKRGKNKTTITNSQDHSKENSAQKKRSESPIQKNTTEKYLLPGERQRKHYIDRPCKCCQHNPNSDGNSMRIKPRSKLTKKRVFILILNILGFFS